MFYDETDKKTSDGNSNFDCQRAVDERYKLVSFSFIFDSMIFMDFFFNSFEFELLQH